MRRRLHVLLAGLLGAGALIAAVPGAATARVPQSVKATFEQKLAKPLYAHTTWGWDVVDMATNESIYSHNANQQFIPGSIMKNYAAASMLSRLGPDYRFRTPVHQLGRVRDGVLGGDLALVGSGDFSFGLRNRANDTLAYRDFDHNESGVVPGVELVRGNPLSGLEDLARQVKKSGVDRVSGDVLVDNRLFRRYEDWPDGRIDSIWVNENIVNLRIEPTRVGKRAKVSWRPRSRGYRATSRVRTVRGEAEPDLEVDRGGAHRIIVSGTIGAKTDPALERFRIPDPARYARTAFIESLRRAGVRVDARALAGNDRKALPRRGDYPPGSRIAQFVSPPLSQYVKVVLKVSYNRGADLFGCMAAVAAKSRDCGESSTLSTEMLKPLGVGTGSTFIFDAAGSVDDARTTPRDMATFHARVAGTPYGSVIEAGLPVMGRNGSLATTLVDSPSVGSILAKTGTRATQTRDGRTVLSAQNFAGYIYTEGGRKLAFTIFSNNTLLPTFNDVLTVFADQGEMSEALQQGL